MRLRSSSFFRVTGRRSTLLVAVTVFAVVACVVVMGSQGLSGGSPDDLELEHPRRFPSDSGNSTPSHDEDGPMPPWLFNQTWSSAAFDEDHYRPLVYVKTYKTASSTVTSVFHNHAVLRNRSCVLPPGTYGYDWEWGQQLPRRDAQQLQQQQTNPIEELAYNGRHWPGLSMWVNHVQPAPRIFQLIPGIGQGGALDPRIDAHGRPVSPQRTVAASRLEGRPALSKPASPNANSAADPPASAVSAPRGWIPEDRSFVTGVRDPVARWISGVNWAARGMSPPELQRSALPHTDWAAAARDLRSRAPEERSQLPYLVRLDSQCAQLGLLGEDAGAYTADQPSEAVRRAWERLERGDHTLLVTERLDESLLVLRAKYGLGFEDLVYRSFKVFHLEKLPEAAAGTVPQPTKHCATAPDQATAGATDPELSNSPTEAPDAEELREWLREVQPCDARLWHLAQTQLETNLARIYPDGRGLQEDLGRMQRVRGMSAELCLAVQLRVGRPMERFWQRPVERLPRETQAQSAAWLEMLRVAGPARLGPWLRPEDWTEKPPVNPLEMLFRKQGIPPERMLDWCVSQRLDNQDWVPWARRRILPIHGHPIPV